MLKNSDIWSNGNKYKRHSRWPRVCIALASLRLCVGVMMTSRCRRVVFALTSLCRRLGVALASCWSRVWVRFALGTCQDRARFAFSQRKLSGCYREDQVEVETEDVTNFRQSSPDSPELSKVMIYNLVKKFRSTRSVLEKKRACVECWKMNCEFGIFIITQY